MLNINRVGVFGDWHGNIGYAKAILNHVNTNDKPDIYIHLGDFNFYGDEKGLNFLEAVNNILVEQNRVMWVVDGNHEDFDWLLSIPINDDGRRQVMSNIYHLPRGFNWTWNNKNFVALGGAASVDKKHRTEGVDWFSQENITEKDVDKALDNENIDVMFTHESPLNLSNYVIDDEEVCKWSNHNRDCISRVTAALKPKLLVHGHHHRAYVDSFLDTQVIGLGKDNSEFDRNYLEIFINEL